MTLYLDTSALVKLYVSQDGHDAVIRLVAAADRVATSIIARPEASSAFAKLARMRAWAVEQERVARLGFLADWPHFVKVAVDEAGAALADGLVARHPLRGMDAIHLAAALTVRVVEGEAPLFAAWDRQLREAAVGEGSRCGRR